MVFSHSLAFLKVFCIIIIEVKAVLFNISSPLGRSLKLAAVTSRRSYNGGDSHTAAWNTDDCWPLVTLPPTPSLALTPTFASTHYLSFTESGIDNLAVSNIDPRRLESVMTCSTVVTAFKNNIFLCLFVLENMIALQL